MPSNEKSTTGSKNTEMLIAKPDKSKTIYSRTLNKKRSLAV